MNCKQVRKYLYAFADGQLDVQVNCEVLDHLKMCPPCAGVVDDHQAMRATLRDHLERIQTPPALQVSVLKVTQPALAAKARRQWRVLVPLATATAACVGFAVFSVWTALVPARAPSPFPGVVDVDGGPVMRLSDALAAKITEKHLLCCSHSDTHQSPELPRALSGAASAIAARFETLKVLAPELSGHGLKFESANFCGIEGPDCTKGGHFLYVAGNGQDRFSVFSVPRKDCLSRCGKRSGDGDGSLRVFRRELDDGTMLRVVLWNQDATTHICCGIVAQAEMNRIVSDVQLAMERPEIRIVLASLWGG